MFQNQPLVFGPVLSSYEICTTMTQSIKTFLVAQSCYDGIEGYNHGPHGLQFAMAGLPKIEIMGYNALF